ncbi:MAG: CPBP family intramembrane metalloprotease [Lachnospiraceae bacterium]|nr:CPBP family intramembrane metalloprotease [Lachnospiraceae bacterium]
MMNTEEKSRETRPSGGVARVIETIVVVFVLGYGLHYLAYFLRARAFTWLGKQGLEEGLEHALMYLGHTFFLIALVVYALAVKKDRGYILRPAKNVARSLWFALLGAIVGFGLMGICVFAARMHGDLEIHRASGMTVKVFLIALVAVFVQASVEELESRAFVFGKMKNEGVPLVLATVVSAFFFSYLHAANPGFGFIPLLSIFVVGILYALSYHYFGTILFTCTAHMMWNFTQDFLLGLPDSGKPAAVSVCSTTVKGSSFFYDEAFGIEGSWMAILVNAACCVLVIVIGTVLKKRAARKATSADNA